MLEGVREGVREGAALEEAEPEGTALEEATGEEAALEEATTEDEAEVASALEDSTGTGSTVRVIVGRAGEPLGTTLRTRWTRRAWCSASPTAARPATRAMVNLLNSMVCSECGYLF
jgi:hypothetical protein